MTSLPFTEWGAWLLIQYTSRSPSQVVATPRGSMGQAATRWFSMAWLTTTSQSAKSSSPLWPNGTSSVVLEPWSGNSSTSSVAAAGALTTAVSGS